MTIPNIDGNIIGLKPNQIKQLERIYRRRIPPNKVISYELARHITEISFEIGRQVGLIADRKGNIIHVIVGDQNEILIPDLSDWRLGKKRLRGVRCIHTHLKNSPLDQGDITDLSILRLDLMAALGIGDDGLPGNIYMAHLLPPNTDAKVYEVHSGIPFFKLDLDLEGFLSSIEDEIARAEKATFDVRDRRERALLVSVSTGSRSDQADSIEELKELARSANLHVIGNIFQRPKKIDPRYLMGSGKVKELIIKALQEGAELVVFDRDLTPAQLMAISTITDMKVIDRTQLILDIFAQRANSMDGKIQVELAQLKYRLPRLSERSTALSRLTGGIGGRGPGETRLEIDMRRARDKIAHLEKQLDALSRSRSERARRRNESGIPIISIVGYTNAGKSTLLNVLTESSVSTKDLLFATLDTSTRRIRFPREREVIITDTVGFIKELPKDLLGAFRPTLDELQDADLLLHVIDISNPKFEDQMKAVENILEEIGLNLIPVLHVFNKADKAGIDQAKLYAKRYNAVLVSALNRTGLDRLLEEIERRIWIEGPHQPPTPLPSPSLSPL